MKTRITQRSSGEIINYNTKKSHLAASFKNMPKFISDRAVRGS